MAKEDENKSNGKIKAGSLIRELLSGSAITEKLILNNLGYVSLITFLLAFYIGNRYHAEKITRETARITREVKDLRAEAMAVSAELMSSSRQSEVYRMVREKGLNLEELKTPPFRLLVSRK